MQTFKIYIDRLKGGYSEKIDLEATPEFLDIQELDLSFPEKVIIKGETYLAEDHLLIHLKIKTRAFLPCNICNEPVSLPVEIDDFYHAEPVDKIKGGVFDYTDSLRESILLQVPSFAECNNGSCAKRETVKEYLKKPEVHLFPFSDLDKS